MSRLHNLFHNPAAGETKAVSTAVAAVLAPESPAEGPASPEVPVVEASYEPEDRLVFHTDPRGAAADRFRLLRMRLKEHWKAGKLKKLLITGPMAGDGKSTVALNLATALVERGKHTVLVVEADLHHSSISEILKLKPSAGITECLLDERVSPLSCIRRVEPFGWHLLAAGEPRSNATEVLQTRAFGRLMQQVTPCFDWIVIDSPPVIPLTDSVSLQQHADASLLVVRAGQTPRETLEQTITLLGKKNIVGVVLNGVEARDRSYYQYYDSTSRHRDD